jgi:hypothetical protein
MTIIVPRTLQTITVEETIKAFATTITIGIEVKVLINLNLNLEILLSIETIALIVLNH